MVYTLFVDESGDFEHFRKRTGWVISGVLVPGKRAAAEQAAEEALLPVARGEGLQNSKQVHVTELRRKTWLIITIA